MECFNNDEYVYGDLNIKGKNMKEIDYFMLFFDDTLLEKITMESNSYFKKKFQHSITKNSKGSYGYFFNKYGFKVQALKAYLGILIYMGLETKSQKDLYWSEDSFHRNNFVRKIMSKNYFKFLTAALHMPFNQNEDNDPRMKLNFLFEYLPSKFKEVYKLNQKICIDESMVYFKGRSKLKFYLPKKPHKWGFKIHLLCDSEIEYVYNMILDPGKYHKNLFLKKDENNQSFIEGLVFKLLKGLENKGHILFIDSWYSSLSLIQKLRNQGIFCTSILKENNNVLKTESNVIQIEDITIYKIEDRKTLNMISTIHDDKITNTKSKPDILYEYNKYAKSVDHVNQTNAFYGHRNRYKKWWKRCFNFCLDVSISNARILYELNEKLHVGMYEFRKNLIYQLIENFEMYSEEDDPDNLQIYDKIPQKYFNALHDIIKLPKTRRRCKYCQRKAVYYCGRCNLPLHPECFIRYHKEFVYK